MQPELELMPHLFRTEYRKIVSVLCKLFGMEHIDIAEDVASDTFLQAAETWGIKGIPANPEAWLYTVAKNKARDIIKRKSIFTQKISIAIRQSNTENISGDVEIDLSEQNIADSQLQMIFAVCHPAIPSEAQIGLALNILCGFGAEEIADAFLTGKEAVYKRLSRAKEKLKNERITIELPSPGQVDARLVNVLTTLYLLFNEGYYSASQNTTIRKELCLEAMRMAYMLAQNARTNTPAVNALLALMCFHVSRFEARIGKDGSMVLYDEQDESLWDKELVKKGKNFLNKAATKTMGKYHFEAAIAYWHTQKSDSSEKWENILHLYNRLLQIEYSPTAALNRTYALAKVYGKEIALPEAEKLGLNSHLYYVLMGHLYADIDNAKAEEQLQKALTLARSASDKDIIRSKIEKLH